MIAHILAWFYGESFVTYLSQSIISKIELWSTGHFFFFFPPRRHSWNNSFVEAGSIFTMSGPKLELRGKGPRKWLVRQIKCKYILTKCSLVLGNKEECFFWDGCNSGALLGRLYLPLTASSVSFLLHCLCPTFLLLCFFLYLLAAAPGEVVFPHYNQMLHHGESKKGFCSITAAERDLAPVVGPYGPKFSCVRNAMVLFFFLEIYLISLLNPNIS